MNDACSVPALEFRILGPFEVAAADTTLAIGPPAQRSLLLALVVHANEVLSTDRLIDLVWGERPPSSAGNLVQGYVSGLRKVIEPDRRARESARVLESQTDGYVLRTDPQRIDAVRFEQLARQGRRLTGAQPARGTAILREALALWRGPALEGYPFASVEAARLEDLRLDATEELFEAELALGSHRLLVPEIMSFVARHPLRERARAQLITALYRSGRQSDALEAYAETRDALHEELGLDPGPDLQRLEAAILRHDPALAPPMQRTNLPVLPSSFVGRESEQKEIRQLLAAERLVTLTGPGGCGKTRIGLSVAEAVASEFADGAWIIDLSPVTDASFLIQAFAARFGLRRESDAALAEAISAHVRTRFMLLLIDNCEHLVDGVSAAVDRLLRCAPDLKVVATSREPLGINGEVVFRVPPLALPHEAETDPVEARRSDAVRLFAERAAQLRRGFRVDTETVADVVRICRRLDGMPLAIELAAGLMNVLSLSQIANRIEDFPDLLETGDRTIPARQRTIQATIRWSYDLLTEPEGSLLDRICAFAGEFTLEGARAIGGDEAPAVLPRLVSKSMVSDPRADEFPPRYRILSSIREFGLRRLQSRREIDDVRQRHARFVLDLVERASSGYRGPESPHCLDRIQRENDDINLALRWSFGRGDEVVGMRLVALLWWLWFLRGPFREAAQWTDAALARRDRVEPTLRMRLLNAGAALAMPLGNFDRVVAFASEYLQLAREQDDDKETAEACEPLAVAAWVRGDYPEAQRLLEEAIALSDVAGEAWSAAGESALLGRILADQGDPDGAKKVLDDAVRRAREIGEPFNIAVALDFSASLASSLGHNETARDVAEESLALYREVGYLEGVASSLNTIAAIARRTGDAARAEDAYRHSLDLCRRSGNVGGIPECLEGLAWSASKTHHMETAAQLLGCATNLRARLGVSLSAAARNAYEDLERNVREALPSELFEKAWRHGTDIDPEAQTLPPL